MAIKITARMLLSFDVTVRFALCPSARARRLGCLAVLVRVADQSRHFGMARRET